MAIAGGRMIELVGLDADDTLWHNEHLFVETRDRFVDLLSAYHDPDWIGDRLDSTERRNLRTYGYGIKGFVLSMIETAIELTEGRVTGREIEQVLRFAKEMARAPVDMVEGADGVVRELAERHRVVIVTKGDLFDQESKVARSGLGAIVHAVEVVSEKDESTYRDLLRRLATMPPRFVMVGNSLRSDIVPPLRIGALAIHVPYRTTWHHEDLPEADLRDLTFIRADGLHDVPALVASLQS